MGLQGTAVVRPRLHLSRRQVRWLALAVAGLLAVTIGGAVWTSSHPGTTVEIESTRGPSPGSNGPVSGPARQYYDLDGGSPAAYPSNRLAIGFLALDGSRQQAVDEFGPERVVTPDISGQAFAWTLAGAELSVSTWHDEPDRISGVVLTVPAGSPARFALYGGVTIGGSTLRDIVNVWGNGYATSTSPYDDFVVRYIECVGPYPIVIKFDQEDPGLHWDEAATSMLVAYADEPPNSAGC